MPTADKTNSPLVTIALLAYEQEAYVAEAVKAVLAQTYQDLEVILSDDHSKDRTFDIIKQEASNYQGKAKVVLNRMEKNCGLAGHMNQIVSMAKGKLLVLAAGDDVSEPARVESLVARWAKADYSSGSIFSEYLVIGDSGKPGPIGGREPFRTDESWMKTSDRDPNLFRSFPGCTHAFTTDSFKVFGNFESGIIQEDIYIQLRSSLIGGVGFVSKPLVRYRQTTVSQSRSGLKGSAKRMAKRIALIQSFLRIFELYERDCAVALNLGHISPDDQSWAVDAVNHFAEPMRNELHFLQSDFKKRLGIVLSARLQNRVRIRWLLYTLFPPLYGCRAHSYC